MAAREFRQKFEWAPQWWEHEEDTKEKRELKKKASRAAEARRNADDKTARQLERYTIYYM